MAPVDPLHIRRELCAVLIKARIRKVVQRADPQTIAAPKGTPLVERVVSIEEIDTGETGCPWNTDPYGGRIQKLAGGSIVAHAENAGALFPGEIRREGSRVVERESLAAGRKRLREAEQSTLCERCAVGIVLEIVFQRQPVLGAEKIVHVAIHLVGLEMGFRSQDNRVSTLALQTSCLETGDPESAIRRFLIHDGQGLISDLARRYAGGIGAKTGEGGICKVCEPLLRGAIGVVEARRYCGDRTGEQLVTDALRLIGAEKEELVLDHRATNVD